MPGLVLEIYKLFLLPLPEQLPATTARHFNSLNPTAKWHDKLRKAQLPHRSRRVCRGSRHLLLPPMGAGYPDPGAHLLAPGGGADASAGTREEPYPGKATYFNSHLAATTSDALSIKSSNNYKWKTADLGADNVFPLD